MTATLTERERAVLEAVIETYVQTAEPAGSRTIAKRHQLGLSPATIRNTMSDLEEKGYLPSPHLGRPHTHGSGVSRLCRFPDAAARCRAGAGAAPPRRAGRAARRRRDDSVARRPGARHPHERARRRGHADHRRGGPRSDRPGTGLYRAVVARSCPPEWGCTHHLRGSAGAACARHGAEGD